MQMSLMIETNGRTVVLGEVLRPFGSILSVLLGTVSIIFSAAVIGCCDQPQWPTSTNCPRVQKFEVSSQHLVIASGAFCDSGY